MRKKELNAKFQKYFNINRPQESQKAGQIPSKFSPQNCREDIQHSDFPFENPMDSNRKSERPLPENPPTRSLSANLLKETVESLYLDHLKTTETEPQELPNSSKVFLKPKSSLAVLKRPSEVLIDASKFPRNHSASGKEIYSRSVCWKNAKNNKAQKYQRQIFEEKLKECTFQPNIKKKSVRPVPENFFSFSKAKEPLANQKPEAKKTKFYAEIHNPEKRMFMNSGKFSSEFSVTRSRVETNHSSKVKGKVSSQREKDFGTKIKELHKFLHEMEF